MKNLWFVVCFIYLSISSLFSTDCGVLCAVSYRGSHGLQPKETEPPFFELIWMDFCVTIYKR